MSAIGAGPALPKGVIVMWSGAIASIPSGWALCDGSNGTPDLRDRFIGGAGQSWNPGHTGGSHTHGHSLSGIAVGVTVNAHTLTEAEIPSHHHRINLMATSGVGSTIPQQQGDAFTAVDFVNTDATGGGQAHSHTASGSASGGQADATGVHAHQDHCHRAGSFHRCVLRRRQQ